MNLKALPLKSGQIISLFLLILLNYSTANCDVRQDLETLRDRCLYYSIGHAPNDSTAQTIRSGLYAQSPFSTPSTEIDIAASGFSLAGLPSAVENGLISKNAAENIAKIAALRIKEMVEKSALASSQPEYEKYGFKGMLYHYYVWSENNAEFQGKNDVEVSSIDTALLMFGLLVCGNYFKGDVLKDYRGARDLIGWQEWLDTSTPDHVNQFRMSWEKGSFSGGWWDWRSEETMLICLFAAMSDSTLNIIELWNAWNKKLVTYISPAPDSKTFTCYATWNGDPFTVFYGLHFFKFRTDINGINWYSQSKIAYTGHVEFFKKERGYLDYLAFAFSDGSNGAIAEPKCNPDIPITRTDGPIYSLAGGLDYYSKNPNSNPIANTISSLVQKEDFFEWTGWPPESVDAKYPTHKTFNKDIIGQNIASIGISIDNYLTDRIRYLVMQDSDLQRIYDIIMPTTAAPVCEGDLNNDGNVDESDLVLFTPDFGRSDCDPGNICGGDFDGDNDVDGKDLRLNIADFGRTDCPLIQITDHPARDGAPAWSPNNSKIAFSSDRSGTSSIWVMNTDGTGTLQLTDNSGEDGQPHWRADSAKLVFYSDRSGNWDIWGMDSDGSNLMQLTDDPASDLNPDISPDGSTIIFESDRDANYDIWLIDVDGGDPIQITDGPGKEKHPHFSPDGSKIVYKSDEVGNYDIWAMDSDGSNAVQLTNTSENEGHPHFSPDGSKIVFWSERTGNREVWMMNADGSDQIQLTYNPANDGGANWSPDGKKLIFRSDRSGNGDIWIYNLW